MSNAGQRGWGNPDASGYSFKMVTIRAANTYVPVHKDVAVIFKDLLTRLSKFYPLEGFPHDDWGYCNRDVRGRPGVKSNHSWGLAIDLNATKNPMTANPDARHQFYKKIVAPILDIYDGLVEWGGDYNVRKDYMHFEFIGTPAQAQDLTNKLLIGNLMAKLDADDLRAIEKIVAKYAGVFLVKDPSSPAQYITNGIHKRHITSVAEIGDLGPDFPDKGSLTQATLNKIKNA